MPGRNEALQSLLDWGQQRMGGNLGFYADMVWIEATHKVCVDTIGTNRRQFCWGQSKDWLRMSVGALLWG